MGQEFIQNMMSLVYPCSQRSGVSAARLKLGPGVISRIDHSHVELLMLAGSRGSGGDVGRDTPHVASLCGLGFQRLRESQVKETRCLL